MKKILACCMAAVLACGVLPVFAADNVPAGRSGGETDELLNFMVVDKPCLEPGETQEIIISAGGEDTIVTSAVLSWFSQEEGRYYETEAGLIEGGAMLFEIDSQEDAEEDVCLLDSLTYEVSGVTYTVTFSDIGIDAKYGVGIAVETEPDAYLVDEDAEYETETGVVTFDAEGNQTSENSIAEAIGEEQAQIPMTTASALSSGNVVVVLDPGHDTTHAGAQYAGLSEETLNLKIAQYCMEELKTYSGVEVYMTRTAEECPFTGSTNSDCLTGRVNYAAGAGADVFVSIHLNASDNTQAMGAQVYYPNANYNAAIGEEGFELAGFIMEELTALGLESRGIVSQNSSDTTYPDGSTADYYAVIRQSKLAGFPGIIVEHAFISNESDRENYLSSEEELRALGVADASGIANYFNLTKSNLAYIDGVWVYLTDGERDYSFNGLLNNAGEYWYFENGAADFTYTGFAEYEGEKWYVEDGIVPFDKNSVINDKTGAIGEAGTWYYVVGGKVQTDFTGLADYKNSYGWWYIVDGKVDFTVNTVAENRYGWWYVNDGKVNFDFTGLAEYENEYGWWYIVDGKVDFDYNGFASNSQGEWYIEGGKITFEENGVLKDTTGAIGTKGTWYYVVESKVQTGYTGVANYKNAYGWWYIRDGVVDFTANTIAKNKNGWWYVADGKVDFSYNGFGENDKGKWYCDGGKVKFDQNSVIKDKTGAIGEAGTWYYVVGSEVQTDFTGLANYKNSYGWWYIVDGAVDFTHNGVDKNKNGWWYVLDGKVQFDFTGLADYKNSYGWWYIVDGKVDFDHNGVDKNKNGWWYVADGKVDFSYNGAAQNSYGWWYIVDGKVDFSYNGTVTVSDNICLVENGKLVSLVLAERVS